MKRRVETLTASDPAHAHECAGLAFRAALAIALAIGVTEPSWATGDQEALAAPSGGAQFVVGLLALLPTCFLSGKVGVRLRMLGALLAAVGYGMFIASR